MRLCWGQAKQVKNFSCTETKRITCTLSDAISQALFSSNFDETIFARQVGSQICWLVAMPKSSKALLLRSAAGQSAGRHLRSVGMRVTWSIPGPHVGSKKSAGVMCCWQQLRIASYESGRSKDLSQHPSSSRSQQSLGSVHKAHLQVLQPHEISMSPSWGKLARSTIVFTANSSP